MPTDVLGGRLAARAMVSPIENIAGAIQQANRAYLDGLPGVTLDGADRIIASLRKKVGPFAQPLAPPHVPRAVRNEAEEMRDTSVVSIGYGTRTVLGGMGVVGPTRMDYPGSIAAVHSVARYVGEILAGR